MANNAISKTIQKQATELVERFNQAELNERVYFANRFRGKHMYLDLHNYGASGPICRLTYSGDLDNWDFAIYKYSSNRYDPEEWMFPGSEHVDGTIEGAMRAGLAAYPP